MRKAVYLIITLALCLSLCACSTADTFSGAAENAEEKIRKWDSESYNTYRYTGTYPRSQEAFSVIMTMQPHVDPIMYSKAMVKAAAREIFKETSKYFYGLDTVVVIAVMSAGGEIMYTFVEDDFR